MLVLLDTNILLSALISEAGVPGRIYRAWLAGAFKLVTSEKQLEEIKRASRYSKFKGNFTPADAGTMINHLRETTVLTHLETVIEADDPDDSFLLSMAIESDADYLVTGDHRAGLLKLGHIKRTRIVTPAVFQAEVLKLH